MAVPAITINESALLSTSAGAVSIGDVLIDEAGGGAYVLSTTANRSTRRSHGIALSAWSSSTQGSVRLQTGGIVDAATTGLGAGAVSWVRVSALGVCERVTPGAGDDLLGKCDALGNLFLQPMTWDSTNYAGGGGGGSTPTGTGIPHIVGGVQDAAASLIVNADVSASAAIAASKVVQATGTGFPHVTAGVLDAASKKVDLAATADVTGTLPAGNGGTGITSLGTGVATFLGTPSGANLASALTTAVPTSKGGTGLTALGSALQVLRTNAGTNAMEWATPSSGSPGGSSGEVQTNDGAGGFAGAANVKAGSGYISLGASPALSGVIRLAGSAATTQLSWSPDGVTTRSIIATESGGNGHVFGNVTDVTNLWGSSLTLYGGSGSVFIYAASAEVFRCTSTELRSAVPRTGLSSAYGVDGVGPQAMADANQTLANTVYCYGTIRTTGLLTANRTITLPTATDAAAYQKTIVNTCTGAFSVVVSVGAGTTVTVANGKTAIVRIDAGGVVRVTADV